MSRLQAAICGRGEAELRNLCGVDEGRRGREGETDRQIEDGVGRRE